MRIWLITALISFSSWGTTFSLQPIDQQIKEADGIVIGLYLRSKSVKLESGILATQMIFKVQREWGMQSDLFGLDEVIVHYPGGKLDGQNIQVQGVPIFVAGEKIALFTRSIDNRYWGLNLGFGSFKIVNYGRETILVNSLFPSDTRVGQVRLASFEDKVKKIKGSHLKVVRTEFDPPKLIDRMPASGLEGKKRSIASKTEQEDNREDQSSLSVFWLMAVLALAGGLTRLLRARGA